MPAVTTYGGVGVNGEWYYPYELCRSTENTGGWVPVSVDMSPFAGATIELDIVTVTDSSVNSNLFIDDVSFGTAAFSAKAPTVPSTSPGAVADQGWGVCRKSAESSEKPARSNATPPAYR